MGICPLLSSVAIFCQMLQKFSRFKMTRGKCLSIVSLSIVLLGCPRAVRFYNKNLEISLRRIAGASGGARRGENRSSKLRSKLDRHFVTIKCLSIMRGLLLD